ncbi:MAG: M48 family metallopeptidase [Burkholderiales bacterium]|nr:M48 family metallopeptidase [Burkholderiales bacterium]
MRFRSRHLVATLRSVAAPHVLAIAFAAILTGCASTTRPGAVGVQREQFMLVSAAEVERMSATSYNNQANQARAQGKLISSGPEYDRLRKIANRIIAQAGVFRDDTKRWNWQLTLIDSPQLNASCMPGGKITFYTGIIRRLKLTDPEIAAIMGHEVAHALREHGREKVSRAMGQQFLLELALGGKPDSAQQIKFAQQVGNVLITLPNSRENETEADRIGIELAARAGYDPMGAVNVWRKMAAAGGGGTPEFLSTHPSHATRINELTQLQAVVRPLYEAAPKP